jgi:glycosyltransferase involved in cell wall biosynthesis
MIQHGVSIIICCHNGASRLHETIRHIMRQVVPAYIPWEFILVNNASTDNTVDIVNAVWFSNPPKADFKIVDEPMLGLSHARAKGFEEAQYEFVVMCDDDNWLADDYVTNTYKVMAEKASIAALGGFGKLVYEVEPPKWIEFAHIFAAGQQSPQTGKVAKNRIHGAGCVIRKSAYLKLKELGFKSMLSDRKGSDLSSGGDYELCYALSIMGYDIWYDERLKFSHFITKDRLNWEYFIRYAKESSTCFDVLTSYKMIAADTNAYKFSSVIIFRDFIFSLRKFININFKRLITKPQSVTGKILYFRHVIFLRKLIAYFTKYNAIEKNHEKILEFKEACVFAEMIKKEPRYATPWFKTAFSFRLLE